MATSSVCPRTACYFWRMTRICCRAVKFIPSVAYASVSGRGFVDDLWRMRRDDKDVLGCGCGSRRLLFARDRFEAVVIRDEQTAPAHALDEALAHEAGDVARDSLRAQADGACNVI